MVETTRIPLFKVVAALRYAQARAEACAALRDALALVPVKHFELRFAIRTVAITASYERFALGCFGPYAIGDRA